MISFLCETKRNTNCFYLRGYSNRAVKCKYRLSIRKGTIWKQYIVTCSGAFAGIIVTSGSTKIEVEISGNSYHSESSKGQAVFVYNTAEQKIPVGTSTISADFGGNATLNPAQSKINVNHLYSSFSYINIIFIRNNIIFFRCQFVFRRLMNDSYIWTNFFSCINLF